MIARRAVLNLITGGATALVGGCGLVFPSDRLRQKMTVEVDTPEGVRSGSAVVETEVRQGKRWGDSSGTRFGLRGEAVAVDLPGDQTLFALLRGVDAASADATTYQTRLIFDALLESDRTNEPIRIDGLDLMAVRKEAKDARLRLELPRTTYPLFVRFRAVDNPSSVERVDPTEFSYSFGAGIELRRITVQVTDADVTYILAKRLAMLGLKADRGLDSTLGVSAKPTLAQQLGYSDFLRE